VAGVVITGLLSTCAADAETPTGDHALPTLTHGVVVSIVDGDTLDIAFGDRIERLRLIGIDTPESVIPGERPECFGPEASAYTAALTPAGTPVRVERDVEARDPYGRLLGYVYVDSMMLNMTLVDQGYAQTMSIPPNTAFASDFARAQRRARDQQVGLWAACEQ